MRGALRGKWWPLTAICLANLMLLIDVTIVITAMPEIARELDAGLPAQQWVLDAYALALAALLLPVGVLGDHRGHRPLYLLGLAVFAVSSLACGLAPGAGVLIASRVAQGVGAAAMFATSAALLAAAYTGRDRGVAFGVWSAVGGAASVTGVLAGGLLTEYAAWRAIFLVNPPLSVVALLLAWLTVPADGPAGPGRRDGRRLDLPGAALFTLCAGALVYGLIRGGETSWGDGLVTGSLALSALALVAFVVSGTRVRPGREPLLDLRLMRRPSFATLMLTSAVFTASAFAHLTYTMLWLQAGLGMSPVGAGLAAMPASAASLVVASVAGRWLDRLPARVPLGGGMALIGVGDLMLTAIGPDSGWQVLTPGLVVSGVGVGLAVPVLSSAALHAAPPERAGMATGAAVTFRQVGFALGVAVLGTVFTAGGHPGSPAAYAERLDAVYLTAGIAGLAAAALTVVFVRTPAPLPRGAAPEEPRPGGTSPQRSAAQR